MSQVVAVVVAAGRSRRFEAVLPKQFADLAGVTMVERSVAAFASHPKIHGVVTVLPPGELDGEVARRLRFLPGSLDVVGGGKQRSDSVRNGVRAAAGASHVLVHDAARPLVPRDLVDRVIEATLRYGAAAPVIEVRDTVKTVREDGFVAGTVDREMLRLAQTPQGARTDWLLEALGRARDEGGEVTDEASALERVGRPVRLVPGSSVNRKITTVEDLEEARRRFRGEAMALRAGTGFDVHRFGGGRSLVLGGVAFPGEPGLEGHSDADVVLHAAMDAVLGATGLGDIGELFPPDDPRFHGADSRDLARTVEQKVRDAGFRLVNVDLTVLAERPRIGPVRDRIRRSVAACLGLEEERVSVKATTLEGLGSLGRKEGIACQAVALVEKTSAGRERG